MAERNPSLWLQQRTDHTAENDRALLMSAFGGREGVSGPTDLAVSQRGAGANMSVDVAAGRAVILGDDSATTQGMYHVWNDAVKNLTIAASDPTNPRKDIVIARVKDAFYSGATNAWELAVVTGTPAASPAEPALPNNAIKLAVVSVAASATSITNANIADSRVRAAALAGVLPVSSSSMPTSIGEGQVVAVLDKDRFEMYDGSAWQRGENWAAAGRTGCSLLRSAVQSIPNNTTTDISFDTESFDSDGFITVTATTATIPAGLGGLYDITAQVEFAASGTYDSAVNVVAGGVQYPQVGANLFARQAIGLPAVPLAAGATVKVQAHQVSGGALNAQAILHLYRRDI